MLLVLCSSISDARLLEICLRQSPHDISKFSLDLLLSSEILMQCTVVLYKWKLLELCDFAIV